MTFYRTLSALHGDLFSGKTTCKQVVLNYLENIERHKEINAFVEVFKESATARAEELDLRLSNGQTQGKLFGLIIGIKDNIVYQSHLSTASSKMLTGHRSIYSATVIERLLAEGAIIIGRLNCDEFAMGSSNETSYYGPVRNPHHLEYVAGGSSGGSAAAVAADLCMASLGSDTGGSIRQPAAFCGIIGLKPTYGRISRYGLMAYGSSFDQIGPMSHSVEDIALILEVIAGEDDYDATSSSIEVEKYTSRLNERNTYKIAYYKEAIEDPSIHPEIRSAALKLVEDLKNQGNIVEPVSVKELEYIVPVYYVLSTAEASSNFSKYDGVRYGYRAEDASDLDSTYKKSRSEGFGKEVQRRIMSGTFVLSSGYYDAYYSKAQKVRRIIAEKTNELLSAYDFILCPTTPTPAFKIGSHIGDPVAMYLGDIFTVQANLVGVPGISIPVGKTQDQLPIGMQLMASKFQEGKLLSFCHQILSDK
ncbi:MAG: Asp-tRNA(Asn)/Glu-tRNA(Gln) amidotransferase subunit GatA [Chitinophagales bacterium]|nr:Asp-tRNA(Asn)/Glu-tRNA(Gln) amidotransferase subunit GatA [Chitinophagales bacterium]MCZ2394232.1 Asp-tRNA(Asn)/Glu-tRNA(Gln) amidotransferase subunit GatA [Chitinophagales bacterium]